MHPLQKMKKWVQSDVPLIKNAKMGQKINVYFNVTGTDSIYSKLLKTVGLLMVIDSICSRLLKAVGLLAVRLDLTKPRLKNH